MKISLSRSRIIKRRQNVAYNVLPSDDRQLQGSRPYQDEMARKLREQHPGAVYHAINRGDYRKDMYRSDNDRRLFLETLGQAFEQPVERSWDLGGQEVVCENTPF